MRTAIISALAVGCTLYALVIPPKTPIAEAKPQITHQDYVKPATKDKSNFMDDLDMTPKEVESLNFDQWTRACTIYGDTIEAAADCLEGMTSTNANPEILEIWIKTGASRLEISTTEFKRRMAAIKTQ